MTFADAGPSTIPTHAGDSAYSSSSSSRKATTAFVSRIAVRMDIADGARRAAVVARGSIHNGFHGSAATDVIFLLAG